VGVEQQIAAIGAVEGARLGSGWKSVTIAPRCERYSDLADQIGEGRVVFVDDRSTALSSWATSRLTL
jgi:hypothetical protein